MWLEQNHIEFSYHDLMKETLSFNQLQQIAGINNLTVKALINGKSQVFKKLNVDFDNLDEKTAADLIIKNPRILIRPLLTDGNILMLGFKEDQYKFLAIDDLGN